ncbi:MAG: 16S rRNA (guanine(527)-N(7))-methyltransferase RsmG [Sphaerospermopsis sp. SIO1G2]|nr:16S rRNA (guanine(527)-N(7))-methyltransferase RsmG [Sphaerospermopsis sp. SIO1G1]NET72929.1 16S rRNA (guanine(527)-N(7))-methyltransferase RsmG [Sphaerospermopsis sp. SIO1G2]
MSLESASTLPEMSEVWHQTLSWYPTNEQQNQLQKLYELIIDANRYLNLTRITEPEDFWEKHLWDSLVGVSPQQRFIDILHHGASVIDIGTGAGFPGLPIAIIFANSQVTLLDSTRKKINFIDGVIDNLALKNAHTVVGRVEEIGQEIQHRGSYDLAVIRAVGSVSACVEYCLPLVKTGGLAVIYRGSFTAEENQSLENAVNIVGGEVELITELKTPLTQSIRHCLYLRKVRHTPVSFPRPVGIPKQKPL